MSQPAPEAINYEGSRTFISSKLVRGLGSVAANVVMGGVLFGNVGMANHIASEAAHAARPAAAASANWQPKFGTAAAANKPFMANAVETPPTNGNETEQLAHDIVDEYGHLHEEPDEVGEADRVREETEGAAYGIHDKNPGSEGSQPVEQAAAQPTYGVVTNIDQLQRIA